MPSRKPQKSVRDRLFQFALHAFASHGYAEVSVDEIVRAARTTKPMLYYYFQSKAGLYAAVAEEAFGRLRAGYGPASDPALAPIERLRAFVRADFANMRESPDLARFIYRTAYAAPRDAPEIDYWSLFLPSFSSVIQIIEAAQAAGLVRPAPPPELALGLFGLIGVRAQVHLAGPMGSLLSDDAADGLVDLFLNGVALR